MGLSDGRDIRKARSVYKPAAPKRTVRTAGDSIIERGRTGSQTRPYQAPVASSPRQSKEAIENGVAGRGLQTGASGAATAPAAPKPRVIGISGGYQILENGTAGAYVGDQGGAPTAPTITTAPTPVPTQPPGAGGEGGGQIGDPTVFDAATLEQMMKGLEAKYGLSREQLLADQSEVGRLYKFMASNLGRMERDAQAGQTESSLGRGILRSGIHLERSGEIEQDFAERRSQAEAEKAQKLSYIQNQMGQLTAEQEAARMEMAQGFGQDGMDYARQYAQFAGQGGPLGVQGGLDPYQGGTVPQPGAAPVAPGATAGVGAGMGGGGRPVQNMVPGAPAGRELTADQMAVQGGYYIDPTTGMAVGQGGAGPDRAAAMQQVQTPPGGIQRSIQQPTDRNMEYIKQGLAGQMLGGTMTPSTPNAAMLGSLDQSQGGRTPVTSGFQSFLGGLNPMQRAQLTQQDMINLAAMDPSYWQSQSGVAGLTSRLSR